MRRVSKETSSEPPVWNGLFGHWLSVAKVGPLLSDPPGAFLMELAVYTGFEARLEQREKRPETPMQELRDRLQGELPAPYDKLFTRKARRLDRMELSELLATKTRPGAGD